MPGAAAAVTAAAATAAAVAAAAASELVALQSNQHSTVAALLILSVTACHNPPQHLPLLLTQPSSHPQEKQPLEVRSECYVQTPPPTRWCLAHCPVVSLKVALHVSLVVVQVSRPSASWQALLALCMHWLPPWLIKHATGLWERWADPYRSCVESSVKLFALCSSQTLSLVAGTACA
jgi:hypothetical protein